MEGLSGPKDNGKESRPSVFVCIQLMNFDSMWEKGSGYYRYLGSMQKSNVDSQTTQAFCLLQLRRAEDQKSWATNVSRAKIVAKDNPTVYVKDPSKNTMTGKTIF